MERASETTRVGCPQVMTFGKWRNCPVTEVDADYLRWCVDSIPRCPAYIVAEIKRRGRGVGVCLGSDFLSERQKARDAKRCRREKVAARQREAALKKQAQMAAGVLLTGSEYLLLRQEFYLLDGDESLCPFDTEDYSYIGPEFLNGRMAIDQQPSPFGAHARPAGVPS